MVLARAYGNTAGPRRPRYAVDVDQPPARTTPAGPPRYRSPGPAQYRRAVDEDDAQRPSWLVSPRPRQDDPRYGESGYGDAGDGTGYDDPAARYRPDARYAEPEQRWAEPEQRWAEPEQRWAEPEPRWAQPQPPYPEGPYPEPHDDGLAPGTPDRTARLADLDARFDLLDAHYDEPSRGPQAGAVPGQRVRTTAKALGGRRPPAQEIVQSNDRPPAEAMAGNRLLTILLFFSGLATSVCLWLFDTQPGAITDSATLMIAAGRITGLIAGYLLFIQLLMMSRVSWLEEWVGARDLLRWHRWLGTSLLVFVLAHIVFIVFGYAVQADTPVVAQAWTMITTLRDMLSATVATGLLAGVGLLAIRRIRTWLPYELWHLLHLAGYLVLLLGYGHQVAVGADLSGRFASVFWPALSALVIAALIWGRIVEPVHLNLRHRFTVADVIEESDDACSIYLTGRHLDRLDAQAGQFMRWRFLNRDGWWQSHPFSLSAAPNPQWLRLTVTAVGTHTDRLVELEPGTKVFAEGPFGTFTAGRRTRRKALLIAGGSGIAPIRALMEEMPRDTMVVYRARTAEDLVFRDELDALARSRGHQVAYVVGGRNDPGPRRLFTPAGMQGLVPDVHRRDVYLCGPAGMVDTAVGVLRDLDVPPGQLHLDPFEF
jgi:predicted ferric reductase